MKLSSIAAMAANRVIGKNGQLPWNIPEDFQFFKDKTMGHIMIMGRVTFESLGGALPGRLHLVVTRKTDYQPEGAVVFSTIEQAVQYAKTQLDQWPDEVFIIGGGEIYTAMLPITNKIYLTEIHQDFEGDTKFPEFSKLEFKETERMTKTGPVPFDFVTYERMN